MAGPYPIAFPQINGHYYSFASLELVMNGVPAVFVGCKSINYSQELEPGEVYGSRPHKIGRTRGKHNANCDLELYRLPWENLKATLGAAGLGYGEQSFNITVAWAELGAPVITDLIEGIRITKVEFSNSEGSDASTVKISTNVMNIRENQFQTIVAPFQGVG